MTKQPTNIYPNRQAREEARMAAEILRQAAEEVRRSTYEQQFVLNEMR